MLDLNFKRRANGKAIAAEVVEEFIRHTSAAVVAPPELLAHHFGLVCQRLNYTPDNASAGRILAYVSKGIIARGNEIDRARAAVDKIVTAI